MRKVLLNFIFIIFCASILAFSIHGIVGNPTNKTLNDLKWRDDGPLELSPERGRFALTFSLVEDNSFFYSLPVARLATPDLGYKNGKYVSLFAPGVSFIIMPGYLLGKQFDLAQLGSFATIALFAIANAMLIRGVAVRLGTPNLPATIAALIFLFATPAFAYASTLYQHHISTFLMLSCIYILIRFQSLWSLLLIWFFFAISLSIDYPNFFLLFPIAIFALGRLFYVNKDKVKTVLSFKMLGIFTFFAAILPLLFFLWFNHQSYGNPLQLSGTIPRVKGIDEQGHPKPPPGVEGEEKEKYANPDALKNKSATGFFKTRNILNGLYIHFLSPDRGIIWYTPVIIFSLLGLSALYKRHPRILSLFLGIIGTNILLYSMWADPWGGWAFGSRYLIPSYAIMAILIAFVLSSFRKNLFILFLFTLATIYSISINTLGAITSSTNPPKVEAENLSKLSHRQEKYTYERNFEFLQHTGSKSFTYQVFANQYLTPIQYYIMLSYVISVVITTMIFTYRFSPRSNYDKY